MPTREEIRNKIFQYIKKKVNAGNSANPPDVLISLDMHDLEDNITNSFPSLENHLREKQVMLTCGEIIQEYVNSYILFIHIASSGAQFRISEYGKKYFESGEIFPYDPNGYIEAIKHEIPTINKIILAYLSEAISTYNKKEYLSSTITLGAASEKLILLLIESFTEWLQEPKKTAFNSKVSNRSISIQFKIFKDQLDNEKSKIPRDLKADIDTYIDGIFGFIRINRNDAGHPTGKELNQNILYANLQAFPGYSKSVCNIINHFESTAS